MVAEKEESAEDECTVEQVETIVPVLAHCIKTLPLIWTGKVWMDGFSLK